MSDFSDLLRRTIEDMYVFGGMSDVEYGLFMDVIDNDPYHIQNLEKFVPTETRIMWEIAVNDYHSKKITDDDYIIILDDVINIITQNAEDHDPIKSYERAMKGI